jgi:hypothetical protein
VIAMFSVYTIKEKEGREREEKGYGTLLGLDHETVIELFVTFTTFKYTFPISSDIFVRLVREKYE